MGRYLRKYHHCCYCNVLWLGKLSQYHKSVAQWHFMSYLSYEVVLQRLDGGSWVLYASVNVKFFGGYLRQYPCRLEM